MGQGLGAKKNKTKNSSTYITGFDGLRTIGVLLVIFYHLNPQIFPGGYFGVPIFMVLSGYLITSSLIKEIEINQKINYHNFFVKRLRRIYPALLTMLMSTSTYILLFQPKLLVKLWQIVLSNLASVYNWWQIFNGQSYFDRFAANESPFTHLWTLSIEGQFYLIWPFIISFLYKALKSNNKRSLAVLILAIISAVEMALLYSPSSINRVYYGTDTRAFSILLGCSLAFVWPVKKLNPRLKRESKILIDSCGGIAAFLMILMIFIVKDQSASLYRYAMFVFSIFATILIAAIAHPGGSLNKILTSPVGTFLGKISYGIYIYQFPVMIFFENKVRIISQHPVLYSVIEIFLILTMSIFSHLFIEQYFGKITWIKFKTDVNRVFNFKNQKIRNIKPKIGIIVSGILIIFGTFGNIVSFFTKVENPENSALAKKIKANAIKQKSHNKIAEKKAIEANKKSKQLLKNQSLSRSVKNSELKELKNLAKNHPVNVEYEKSGLTQIQLQKAQKTDLVAIGDSVMVDGQTVLTKLFPRIVIDAAVSRQASALPDILKEKLDQGVVSSIILVGLGTNGILTPEVIDHTMELATSKRNVFWLTDHVPTRSWQDTNNNVLRQQAQKYQNMHIIDWHQAVAPHQDWLYDDLVHPTPSGSEQYGILIAKNILQVLEKK